MLRLKEFAGNDDLTKEYRHVVWQALDKSNRKPLQRFADTHPAFMKTIVDNFKKDRANIIVGICCNSRDRNDYRSCAPRIRSASWIGLKANREPLEQFIDSPLLCSPKLCEDPAYLCSSPTSVAPTGA